MNRPTTATASSARTGVLGRLGEKLRWIFVIEQEWAGSVVDEPSGCWWGRPAVTTSHAALRASAAAVIRRKTGSGFIRDII
jgi:hypothetical protein